jgi:hypothetical protein
LNEPNKIKPKYSAHISRIIHDYTSNKVAIIQSEAEVEAEAESILFTSTFLSLPKVRGNEMQRRINPYVFAI